MADQDRRFELDREYNLRAAVPGFQSYIDRYHGQSAALRSRLKDRARLDLAYGTGLRQGIDLFLPDAAAPPLLVFLHGGYWHSQDRKVFSFVAGPFVEAGIAVAVMGYDLAPAVDLEAITESIRSGLGWLFREGRSLGVDPGRLFVAGHSAGGHLTAMMLATSWAERGLPTDLIKGAIPISGIFDLEPIRDCYLNDVLALSPEQVLRLSPERLIPKAAAPAVVAVGGGETRAFITQSERYAASLRAQGQEVVVMVEPGLDHFAMVESLGFASSATGGRIRNLIEHGTLE